MKKNLFTAILSTELLLTACGPSAGGPEAQQPGDIADSLSALEDESTQDSTEGAVDSSTLPSASADALFDDFVYNFMRNKRFQMARILFPLKNMVDGHNKPIKREDWQFDQLYARQDVYTMLFDNAAAMRREQDSTITAVTVEWIYLTQHRVKQYLFEKTKGQWMLVALNTHALAEHAAGDFYDFYHHFVTDENYQRRHIASTIRFRTYDADAFQEINGVLDAAQWPDFRPDMPTQTLTNINYGQQYDGPRRVLVITSPSAGMSCTLTFENKSHNKSQGTGWMLVALESI